jgi:hypothetical protein
MYSVQGIFQHNFQCKKVHTILNKIWYINGDEEQHKPSILVSAILLNAVGPLIKLVRLVVGKTVTALVSTSADSGNTN